MLTQAQLKEMCDQIGKGLSWFRAIPADRDAKFSELNENEFFRRGPAQHKREVLVSLESEYTALRAATLSALIYEFTTAIEPLGVELAAATRQARRAPGPVDAFLKRSGGTRHHLTTGEELAIETLHELRRMRLASETASWQPSKVRDAYVRAVAEGDDASISYFEDPHSGGFSGPPPASDDEVAAAVELRRAIDVSQFERVPPVLDEMEQTAAELRRLLSKTTGLYKLVAINPKQRPDLAETIAAGLEELATIEVEPEPEPEPEVA